MDEKGQLDLHINKHLRVLVAGGKFVIPCNIESTLPSAATPFDGTDFVKLYREDRSAAMPRTV